MSKVPSELQKVQRSGFADAVAYAKSINNDPVLAGSRQLVIVSTHKRLRQLPDILLVAEWMSKGCAISKSIHVISKAP